MINRKVVAIICVYGRCWAYTGIVTDIKKRWFRKPVYILDGKYRSTQIIRDLTEPYVNTASNKEVIKLHSDINVDITKWDELR